HILSVACVGLVIFLVDEPTVETVVERSFDEFVRDGKRAVVGFLQEVANALKRSKVRAPVPVEENLSVDANTVAVSGIDRVRGRREDRSVIAIGASPEDHVIRVLPDARSVHACRAPTMGATGGNGVEGGDR